MASLQPSAGISLSVSKLAEEEWLLGNHILIARSDEQSCTDDVICSWKNEAGAFFTLRSTIPHQPSLACAVPPFRDPTDDAAIWNLAGVFCKVTSWAPGVQHESTTIEFVREKCPSIPVPEVVYAWTEEGLNRSFLILKLVPGDTFEKCWTSLNVSQRQNIAADTAKYCIELAKHTSDRLQSSSGGGVTDPWLQPMDSSTRYPSPLGPFSLEETRSYLSPIRIGERFVSMHADLAPPNIVVQNGVVTGIIDWQDAAFYPEFWMRAQARSFGNQLDEAEDPWEWTRLLDTNLERLGVEFDSDSVMEWHSSQREKDRLTD